MPGFAKTFDDAEAVLLAGLAHDPNPLFLTGHPPLLSPIAILAMALAVLSRAQPMKIARALAFDVIGPLPARGATLAIDIPGDETSEFSAHGIRGRIEVRGADHADRSLRLVPPVLLSFGKLVTETDIVLACGLTGDVHPWHLQDVAARAAGLAARPLPTALLLALCMGRCEGAQDGRLPRHASLTVHRLPVLGDELRFARTGAGAEERIAVVVGVQIIADSQFEFGGASP